MKTSNQQKKESFGLIPTILTHHAKHQCAARHIDFPEVINMDKVKILEKDPYVEKTFTFSMPDEKRKHLDILFIGRLTEENNEAKMVIATTYRTAKDRYQPGFRA